MKHQNADLNPFNFYKQVESQGIISRKTLAKCFRNWYWYVLTVILAGGLAYLYGQYTTPVYEITSSMLVEEGKNASPLSGGAPSQNIFQGLGLMNSMQNIHNQMVVISSTPVISKTISELDFEVSYYSIGRFAAFERYQQV